MIGILHSILGSLSQMTFPPPHPSPYHVEMFFTKQNNPHNRSQKECTSKQCWNSILDPQSADSGQRLEALGNVGIHIPSLGGK